MPQHRKRPTQQKLVVEITILWLDRSLDVRQLHRRESLTVGENPRCDVWVPREQSNGLSSIELVSVDEREVKLLVPKGATLSVEGGDQEAETSQRDDEQPRQVRLPVEAGWAAMIELDELSFRVCTVEPELYDIPRRRADWAVPGTVVGSLLLHGFLMAMVFNAPPKPRSLSLDSISTPNRFVRLLIEEPPLQVEERVNDDHLLGGKGKRHRGEEGQMARGDAKRSENRYGIKGPADNPGNLSTIGRGGGSGHGSGRDRRVKIARNGVLASNFVGGRGVEARLSDLLDRGVLVDGETVRLEAFQERQQLPYRVPASEAVALYAELERSRVVAEGDQAHLQIALVAKQGELPVRPRMDVRLVLDRSGSMAGGKWSSAIAAAHAVVDRLRPGDTFGLISYSDDASLDVTPSSVGDGRAIHRAIDALRPGGGTNISAALGLAGRHSPRRRRPNDLGLVMLISDGVANAGLTAPHDLGALSRGMFDRDGVLTTTVGLGTDFDEQTMLTLAREGNGSYHFVRRPAEIAGILQEELEERAQAVAQALRVRVVLADGVEVRRVYGSHMLNEQEHAATRATEVAVDQRLAQELGIVRDRRHEEEEGLRIHLGSFRRGDQHLILMELDLPEGRVGSEVQVAQVFLDYKDLGDRSNRRLSHNVSATRVEERSQALASLRRPVKRTVLAFQAGEALQSASHLLRNGDIPRAQQILAERRELLETAASLWRDPLMERDAQLIARYETVVAKAYPSWADQERRTLMLAMNHFGDQRMR